MSLEIIPSGAALGAEIRGVDLAQPLDDATFAAIERAYATHGVVFFRGQRISPAQHVAFTRRFGEIEFNIFGERWSVPGNPEIVVVSNVTEDGRPIGVRRAGENWHSDMCYTARPPRPGMPCLSHSGSGSTGASSRSTSVAGSDPSRRRRPRSPASRPFSTSSSGPTRRAGASACT